MQIGRAILPPSPNTSDFHCESLTEEISIGTFSFPLEQSLAQTNVSLPLIPSGRQEPSHLI
jgi:hypothetical protein